jgi:hypothetical protein
MPADLYTITYRVSDPDDFVDCSVKVNMGINISEVQQWNFHACFSTNCTPGEFTGVCVDYKIITLKMVRPGGDWLFGDGSNGYYAYVAGADGNGQFPAWDHLLANSSGANITIRQDQVPFEPSTGACGWIGPKQSLQDVLNPPGYPFPQLFTAIVAAGGSATQGLCGTDCFVQGGGPNAPVFTLEAGQGTSIPIDPPPSNFVFTYQE